MQHHMVILPAITIVHHRVKNASNLFTGCREMFEDIHLMGVNSIPDFWKRYNNNIGLYPSADFKNYFKYIHREVSCIMHNSKDILEPEDQKRYVKLIEGQMNNDELFCYFINQLEYWISHKYEKEVDEYANYLKDNEFFKEICLIENYRPLIKKAWDISKEKIGNNEPLMEKEWFAEENN